MSLATDLSIVYTDLMVGRNHPSLSQTLDVLPEAIAASGMGANLVPNGSFDVWPGDITNIAPVGWSLKGTPTDVSRDTGDRDNYNSPFAVKITSNGSGNEGITITLADLKASTTYSVSVRAKVTAGDTARIWTTGASSNADTNTTSTSWVTLEDTFTTDATPTSVVLNLGSNTATDIVWFDLLNVMEGEVGAIFVPQHISHGNIVQLRYTQTGAVATGTTQIPNDDTIPQNTEGDEYMTLAMVPTDSNNLLKITIVGHFSSATNLNNFITVALFQDSTANALAVGYNYENQSTGMQNTVFTHYMTAGTTSVTTFKVRAGQANANTTTFNGQSGGRKYGGVLASSITIEEIKQ